MSTIGPIGSSVGSAHMQVLQRAQEALKTEPSGTEFTDRIVALNRVADAQTKSAKLAEAYEMGVENDLSKVMVSQQVSSLEFQLTLNVRNKVLSAYKDIMNMLSRATTPAADRPVFAATALHDLKREQDQWLKQQQ